MPVYTYRVTHSAGYGHGSIEAKSVDDAREKLTASFQPSEDGGEKLKNLKFEITEVEPAPEA